MFFIFGFCFSIISAMFFEANHGGGASIFFALIAVFFFVYGASERIIEKLKK